MSDDCLDSHLDHLILIHRTGGTSSEACRAALLRQLQLSCRRDKVGAKVWIGSTGVMTVGWDFSASFDVEVER